MGETDKNFVSRAGAKLDYALDNFQIDLQDKICADLGSNAGGFTDVMLQRGAKKVYAVDTGYGVLDWNLRNNSKVVEMERTNALYVDLPEKVDFISIDVGWTRQQKILPKALSLINQGGAIVSLLKTHYEADKTQLVKGKVKPEEIENILTNVKEKLNSQKITIDQMIESPIIGKKGKNTEYLLLITK